METSSCEGVEQAKSQTLQGGDTHIQKSRYYNNVFYTQHGFTDSSDEDDYTGPLGLTSEESSVCCVCGDNVPFLDNILEHFKTHTTEVRCHLCRAKFGRVISLALHLKNAHPNPRLLCAVCGVIFSCTWHLNGHMEKHWKEAMNAKALVKSEEAEIKETTSRTDLSRTVLSDHSYGISARADVNEDQERIDSDTNTNQASNIQREREILPDIKEEQNDTIISSSFPSSQSDVDNLSSDLKVENDNEDELGASFQVAAEEEIGPTEGKTAESSDSDEDANPDSLPPGDTAYSPDEDHSSDSDDIFSYSCSRRTKPMKKYERVRKTSSDTKLQPSEVVEKFGFQSDSPFCCYGKFANLGKHMDDCKNKPVFVCCLCSVSCANEDLLLKHMSEKHPTALYICSKCNTFFQGQDTFKNHVCLKRTVGNINLPASQLPVVPLSGQVRPSAPALPASQNTVKIITITQAGKKTDPPTAVGTLGSTKPMALHQLLKTNPLVSTNLVAVPQNPARPNFLPGPCLVRPNVSLPACPLLPNMAKVPLHIPMPSHPSIPTQIVVSFSPTVNGLSSALVSSSKPVLRQTSVVSSRPVHTNVPLITSGSCPSLVNALTRKSQPQVPPPPEVQAPLRVLGLYVNQRRDFALQKRLEQSWRYKTIFTCRHCGAISRQPSLRVRHRYLHRGSRLYRCQCGRTFLQQMHLLRHQVQHAESVRFVCARCGNTFEGAHKLSWHKRKRRNGTQCMKKKCKAAFNCSCGQMFARPSALLWHMLKNSKNVKHSKRNSQSVSF